MPDSRDSRRRGSKRTPTPRGPTGRARSGLPRSDGRGPSLGRPSLPNLTQAPHARNIKGPTPVGGGSSFPSINITRRTAIRAAVGTGMVAAVAGTVGVIRSCTNAGREEGTPTVVDRTKADYVIDPQTNESNYSSADLELTEGSTWTIDLGNVLHPGEGTWIPVTTAGSSAAPMVKGSALSTKDGSLVEVVTEPLADDKSNVVVYDVRCSDAVYAWVELNVLTHEWVLYASSFSSGSLTGSPMTLWSAGADYAPASFAVSGSKVIWQVMPSLSGHKTSEKSVCYVWSVGDANAKAVVESPGRFACAPEVSQGMVTLVPRVNADRGTYYGITAYQLSDDLSTQVDRLVLPATVRPLTATRIGDEFAFSIEASYSSGGLLGTMGTYIGHGEGPFVVLSREPAAGVVGKDERYVIRVSSSYFVVNTKDRSYSTLVAANRSMSYGEYPARSGQSSDFVTFSTVKAQDTGYPESVVVRSFSFPS